MRAFAAERGVMQTKPIIHMSQPAGKSQIFRPAHPAQFNAILDYGRPSWNAYADGYKEAADIVARALLKQGATLDTVIYPLAFLYRQYLELRLKQLSRDCSALIEREFRVKNIHGLAQLWAETRALLREAQAKWSDRSIKIDFQIVDRGIKDFAATDSTSMAFRYPEDKDENRHNVGLTHVNVWTLYQEMQAVQEALETAATAVSIWSDFQQESYGNF